MKLSEVTQAAADLLAASPALGSIPVTLAHDRSYSTEFEAALDTTGVVIAIVYVGGRLTDATKAVLRFEHELLIAVAENLDSNETGKSALEYAEHICELFHQRNVSDKSKEVWSLDDPAISPGPSDAGLPSWLVTLTVKSIQPVNPNV